MKIIILTWGSDGDIFPYIALGLGLQKAGHLVKIATTSNNKDLIIRRGLEFASVDCKAWEKPNSLAVDNQNPFLIARYYNRFFQSLEDSYLPLLEDICKEAEVIIFSSPSFSAYEIVEKLRVPAFAACIGPVHQTREFPNHFTPNHWRCGGIYNQLTYLFFNQLFWLSMQKTINQWRQRILNLPSIPIFLDLMTRINRQKLPFLYCFSPAFLPKPLDWPEWVDITGYWFLDTSIDWQPPQKLMDFLADGSPPVYIGFGNRGEWEAEALTKLVLEALEISGQRGILLVGEDLIDNGDLPHYVFPTEWVPFDWLFPKMAAVVHHGGCGTVHTALRAGVPNIIIPYDYDNFFWGYRIAEFGVAPFPIHKNKLSAKRLASAIQTAVSDQNMKTRVAALSKKVQAENGVQQAVEMIHQHLQSHVDKVKA